MNKKSRMLKVIFEPAIDEASSNTYRTILLMMGKLPVEAKKVSFTLQEMYDALEPLSKQWDKGIDKVIGL